MNDVPGTQQPREHDRLTTRGRSTDEGSWSTLLVIHEADGPWTLRGLGASGMTPAKADVVTLAEAILERARGAGTCAAADRRRPAGAR